MNNLTQCLEQRRARGEGALIAYLMAGDPDPRRTIEYALAVQAGGADVLELGIPFSDPIADGPTIQAASLRALRANVTVPVVMQIVRALRTRTSIPIVLLTYYNPVFRIGEEAFVRDAVQAGVDGIAIPDLPVQEAGDWVKRCERFQVHHVFFVTPETDDDRARLIAQHASGFLYLVSRYGTTGAHAHLADTTTDLVRRMRRLIPSDLPLATGFGISRPEHVQSVIRAGADAAIVGSALVARVEQSHPVEAVQQYVRELKYGTLNQLGASS